MIYFYFYTFATRRFGTLSNICHAIKFYEVSYFVVSKWKIISYTKVVNKGLIILECVKSWRSLLVPIKELWMNKGKAIGVFKVNWCEGKDTRFFRYFNAIIMGITITLLIGLNCKWIQVNVTKRTHNNGSLHSSQFWPRAWRCRGLKIPKCFYAWFSTIFPFLRRRIW